LHNLTGLPTRAHTFSRTTDLLCAIFEIPIKFLLYRLDPWASGIRICVVRRILQYWYWLFKLNIPLWGTLLRNP